MALSKELRKLYGMAGEPTVCVSAKVRAMAFDHDGRLDSTGKPTRVIKARAWCLTNDKGQVAFVQSYDGRLGANVSVVWMDATAVNSKKLATYEPATPEELADNKWIKVVESTSAVA